LLHKNELLALVSIDVVIVFVDKFVTLFPLCRLLRKWLVN